MVSPIALVLFLVCFSIADSKKKGDDSKKRDDDSDEFSRKPKWEKMPGHAVQISAKGSELWAINKWRQILRWQGNAWVAQNNFGMFVSASADGWAWIVRPTDAPNIYKINPANKQAVEPCCYAQTLTSTSRHNSIHVGGANCLHRHQEGVGWTHTDKDCNSMIISMGDAEEQWRVDVNGDVYRLQPITNPATTWVKVEIPRPARYIDVQAADRVVMTDEEQTAWLFNGKDWVQLQGLQCDQATINYRSIFCIGPNNSVWKLNF